MSKRKLILYPVFVGKIALVFVIFFSSRCTFKKPNQPEWNIVLNVPVADKTYTMEELADETKYLTVDSDKQEIVFKIASDFGRNLLDFLDMSIQTIETKPYNFGLNQPDSVGIQNDVYLLDEPAEIESGEFYLRVENPHNYSVHLHFETSDLNHHGQSIQIDRDVPANKDDEISFPIDDYVLTVPVWNNKNYFRYEVNPTGGSVDQTVKIFFYIKIHAFKSVTGWFSKVAGFMEDIEIETGLTDEFEAFKFGYVELQMTVENQLPLSAQFDFYINALETTDEQPDPLIFSGILNAADEHGTNPEITITNDVTDFINSQPKKLIIGGLFESGDDYSYGTILEEDSLVGTITVLAPLIFRLPSDTTKTEIDTLEIDVETSERIHDNINEISMVTNIENHLPISAEIKILLSKSRGDSTIYDHPDLVIGPISLAQTSLEGDPAEVSESASGLWKQVLTKQNLTLFEEKKLYLGTQFIFLGTGGVMAKVRPSDYIRISMHLTADVSTKIPDDDEEGSAQ